jgi:hypothetical protein
MGGKFKRRPPGAMWSMSRFVSELKCRTPHAGEWVRVNPDPAYRREVTLARNEEGEYHLIALELVPQLPPGRVPRSMLFIAANQEGKAFLWPVELPMPEDHLAYRAMREWVRFPSETRH